MSHNGQDMNHDTAEKLTGQAAGLAQKGINGAINKAGNAVKKLGKKAAKVIGKAVKKVAFALGKIILKLIIAFLPYILVGLMILFILIAIAGFFHDEEYESKAVHDNYQTEEASETNPVVKNPHTGEYELVGYSNGNKLFKMFYGYMAQRGYWKVEVDANGKPVSDLYRGDSEQGKYLVDRYNREKYFTITSDLLYLLDTELNAGYSNKFFFPEQFIQPVYHDENFNLKMLTDEEHELVVKSTKYDENGKPTNEKVPGVWDYGFGSILQYQRFKEEREKRGSLTKTYVWDFEKHELVPVEYAPGESDDKIVEKVAGYPITVYMIRKVTTPIGTLERSIKHEWVQTNEKWTKTEKVWIDGEKLEEYWKPVQAMNSDGEPLYWRYHPEYTSSSFNFQTTEVTPWPVMEYVKDYRWVPAKIETEKIYTGYVWEKIPVYEGEMDTSGIVGDRYFFDYLTNYEAYVPDVVMEEFNIQERTNRNIEGLEDIFKEQSRVENVRSIYDELINPVDFDPQKKVDPNNQSLNNALKYLPYFEKYGERYGVDPYLMVAIAAQESSGLHDEHKRNYGGYGLMQIENPGRTIKSATAFNVLEGREETMIINGPQDVDDVEDNIRAGAMLLAGRLKNYKYNIYVGLQAYNYGPGGIGAVLDLYGTETGKTRDEILSNPQDLGWMEYRMEVHQNPTKYFEWTSSTYGDPNYVENVMRYYIGPEETPYIIDAEGNKHTASGEITFGVVNVSRGINNRSWFNGLIAALEDKWDELFEESPADALQNKEDYKWTKHENHLTENEFKTFMKQFWSFYLDTYFSEVNDEITLEDWKRNYTILFENPVPQYSMDEETKASYNRLNALFPNGYQLPLDKVEEVSREFDGFSIGLRTSVGTPVLAVSDGTVITANSDDGVIEIKHTGGVVTRYMKVKNIKVKAGNTVKQGDYIAETKDTELGFSIYDGDGASIDPSMLLKVLGDGSQNYDYETVLNLIESVKGTPYKMVSDANDPKNGYFDCSGLLQWAFGEVGYKLPRTAEEQYNLTVKIHESQARPGDLVFFKGTTGTDANRITHVGLYIGDGKFWHAGVSQGVSISDIHWSGWKEANPNNPFFGRLP